MTKLVKVYDLTTYTATNEFIKNSGEEYEMEELVEILEKTNKGYHFRIDPTKSYKFFGDCDGYTNTIENFIEKLTEFLKERYEIIISKKDFSYTINYSKKGSYHYVIPKLYGSCNKLKEIHTNFFKENEKDFKYTDDKGKMWKIIDTTIYSKHWFRLPNQLKENKKGTQHIIVKGDMKDFIVEDLDGCNENIDDKKYINKDIINSDMNEKQSEKVKTVKIKEEPIIEVTEKNNNIKTNIIKEKDWTIFYKLFDECYKQYRFDTYEYWVNVGMGIKTSYGDKGFELFKYFSNKGKTPDSEDKLKIKYDTFSINLDKPITINTVYFYAKEDNKDKFIEIIKNFSIFKELPLTSTDIAQYIKELKPNYFIWKDKNLYCYNGRYWIQDDLQLRIYISTELYDFLKDILVTCYWNVDKKQFDNMKKSLDKLKSLQFKREIVETTREYLTNDEVEFDNKYYLFGFKNCVYDLNEGKFRNYKQDDYITMTVGYDWREPTQDEIQTVYNLLKKIFHEEDILKLYLEIVSTGLEGRCLEKFTILNGKGRNGKGLLSEILLKAFGEYGFIGNNAILFEVSKTGSNPEKANLHKKRLVIFREPKDEKKFENSVVKELTGGGKLPARGHNESKTEKDLHCTILVECNKKPLFAEEPQTADIERLIDLYFGSTFVSTPEQVDEKNRIYLGNLLYKTDEFQHQHKYALLSILFNAYKIYKDRGFILNIPKCVKERTDAYLKLSSTIITWINETYERTDSKSDYVKLKDMYNTLKTSSYFENLSRTEKRTYTYSYFVKSIADNIFLKNYYYDAIRISGTDLTNIIRFYKVKLEDTDNE
jgi:hypothetical protein